ncbi:MAG: hypothetical protein ACYTBJ_25950, partial [Planctomycetota bacterium]
MKTGWEIGCKLVDRSGEVYEVVSHFNQLMLKNVGTGILYGSEMTQDLGLEPFGGTKVKNADMYVFPTQQEADKFCERIEPTAPFTREEIDALIDAYPECWRLKFADKRIQSIMSDYYPKSERNIWFNNCVDWKNEGVAITYNQISINGT